MASTQSKRIGVFGGSFNPIHVGHIGLARQIMQKARLDEVWFIVSPLNPFKKSATDLLDDRLRLLLARKALEGEPGLVASDYEFHLPKPSYTWNTLQHLQADYPACSFVLIVGADNWRAFDRWAHPDYILANFEIAVYARKDCPVDEASLPAGVKLVDAGLYPVSSTEIRRRAHEGKPVSGLVPPQIEGAVTRLYGMGGKQQSTTTKD